MNEFELIQSYLAGLAGPEGLGLLDDVALWSPPKGLDTVFSTDTLVEGVHFPKSKFDSAVAQKLIRTNISDIIAKGADPLGYQLSLTLNENIKEAEFGNFCNGLAKDQRKFGLSLWGGDTTRTKGPNVLTLTIIGTTTANKVVKRSDAKSGDVICVTGTIGNSYLGLKTILNQMDVGVFESELKTWTQAYHIPDPPFKLRKGIRSAASAALDISDGLIADAGHMARTSNKLLEINLDTIPLSIESALWVDSQKNPTAARIALATGGDDYQVLMAVNPEKFDELDKVSKEIDILLTKIGRVKTGKGVRVLDVNSKPLSIEKTGYLHFE